MLIKYKYIVIITYRKGHPIIQFYNKSLIQIVPESVQGFVRGLKDPPEAQFKLTLNRVCI